MIRRIIVLLFCINLSACMSGEDIAQYMHGSWKGKDGDRSWCVTYSESNGDTSANMYIQEPNVTLNGNNKSHMRVINREGFLITARGMRFQLNIADTHTSDGEFIPNDKRGGRRSHYFIANHSDTQFTYQSANSEKEYSNTRVADCAQLEAAFSKYIETLKN